MAFINSERATRLQTYRYTPLYGHAATYPPETQSLVRRSVAQCNGLPTSFFCGFSALNCVIPFWLRQDPILTAFELSWELKRHSRLENEFKEQYEALATKCQDFAVALLDQTRGSKVRDGVGEDFFHVFLFVYAMHNMHTWTHFYPLPEART